MFYNQIIKYFLRCINRDCRIFLRSGLDFLFNFIFLYNLKKNLKKIKPQIKNIDKKKSILVDCYPNSLLYTCALVIHTFPIQKFFNANCIVYSSNFSFTKSYLLSILGNHKIVYLESFIRNLFTVIKNFKTLKIEFSKIQKIKKDYYDYKFDGIEIGKIAYDHYLRKQMYGRLKDLNIYKYFVFLSIIEYFNIKEIVEKNIFLYSGKETQFLPRAIVLQACLKNSIKSFIVWGSHDNFSVRKYSHFSQRFFGRNHINKHNFIKKMSKNSINIGKEYIEDKFFSINSINKSENIDTNLAFRDNLKKLNKENFLKMLGLDIKKKTAVIFSHCSYDGVYESPRIMYDNFYSWLEETILVLLKNDKINVIIKKHPTEEFRKSLNISKEIYEKHNLKNVKHIKLLNNEFHPSTLLKVVDFNITARGTVGPEYGAFSVPCISTDYTPYNYCSFNHNFKDKNNYSKQLMELPKLFNNENSKYKIDAYHYLNLSFKESKTINPYFASEIHPNMPKNYSIIEESKYLNRCIDLIKKSNSEDKRYFYEVYKNYFENNEFTMFNNY